MPASSIVFDPEIDERQLDREVGQIDDRLASVGEDVPVSFDEDELDSLSPAGGGGGGGGIGAGTGAGAAAGLASKIPKPVAGVTAASALPIAIAGGVGLGLLSQLRDSSGRLQTTTTLFGQALNIFFRPFGNALDKVLRPAAQATMDLATDFSDLASEDGLAVAVASLAPKAAEAIGNAFGNIATGQGNLGDIALAGGATLTAAKLAGLLPSVGLGAVLGGMSGSALTGLLPRIGLSSFVTGMSSGSLLSLLPSVGAGSLITGTVAGATLIGTVAAGSVIVGTVAATSLIEGVTLQELIENPDENVTLNPGEQEEAVREGTRFAGPGGPNVNERGTATPRGDPMNRLGDNTPGVDPRNVPSRGTRPGGDPGNRLGDETPGVDPRNVPTQGRRTASADRELKDKLDENTREVRKTRNALEGLGIQVDRENIGRVVTEGKRQDLGGRDPTV